MTDEGRHDDRRPASGRGRVAEQHAAFSALYLERRGEIAKLCSSILRDRADAEDATEEAFTKVWRAMLDDRVEAHSYPWLRTVARNHCYDLLRKKKRSQPADHVQLEAIGPPSGASDSGIVANSDAALVRESVRRVAAGHRSILALREESEMSYQQIADLQSVPVSVVESRLYRARQAVRREFLALAGPEGPFAIIYFRFRSRWFDSQSTTAQMFTAMNDRIGGTGITRVGAVGSVVATTAVTAIAAFGPVHIVRQPTQPSNPAVATPQHAPTLATASATRRLKTPIAPTGHATSSRRIPRLHRHTVRSGSSGLVVVALGATSASTTATDPSILPATTSASPTPASSAQSAAPPAVTTTSTASAAPAGASSTTTTTVAPHSSRSTASSTSPTGSSSAPSTSWTASLASWNTSATASKTSSSASPAASTLGSGVGDHRDDRASRQRSFRPEGRASVSENASSASLSQYPASGATNAVAPASTTIGSASASQSSASQSAPAQSSTVQSSPRQTASAPSAASVPTPAPAANASSTTNASASSDGSTSRWGSDAAQGWSVSAPGSHDNPGADSDPWHSRSHSW
jgi:RNA polymerase sigma factor (sigma-70 family)